MKTSDIIKIRVQKKEKSDPAPASNWRDHLLKMSLYEEWTLKFDPRIAWAARTAIYRMRKDPKFSHLRFKVSQKQSKNRLTITRLRDAD